jgi:hypothetical protein
MILEDLTLMVTSGFATACVYLNLVEQPARLGLEPAAMLAQWKVSYRRGTRMQLSLAILAAMLAIGTCVATHNLRWLIGASCLLAIAPYTLLAIMPVNRKLSAIAADDTETQVFALVRSWGNKHAVRSVLGLAAAAVFLWARSS